MRVGRAGWSVGIRSNPDTHDQLPGGWGHVRDQRAASEVHAMVEGVMRHDTTMNVDTSYVDSH
ncbi:MAG: hypothetical protein ACRDOE_04550, partial [Streptosporangiaceae bacterium]